MWIEFGLHRFRRFLFFFSTENITRLTWTTSNARFLKIVDVSQLSKESINLLLRLACLPAATLIYGRIWMPSKRKITFQNRIVVLFVKLAVCEAIRYLLFLIELSHRIKCISAGTPSDECSIWYPIWCLELRNNPGNFYLRSFPHL